MENGLSKDRRFMQKLNEAILQFKKRTVPTEKKFDFDAPIDLVGIEL